jgi:hypothetical protein
LNESEVGCNRQTFAVISKLARIKLLCVVMVIREKPTRALKFFPGVSAESSRSPLFGKLLRAGGFSMQLHARSVKATT